MISETLLFLKQDLNAHLRVTSGASPDESREDTVVFLDGEKMDPITFQLGAVSALLINLEEENILRAPNPYQRAAPDGRLLQVQPDIRLNLYVLFVARFKQYEESLHYLSLIVQYFQTHRVFNHHNAPALSENITQLIMELITLPFAEQNEVWNALRTPYHPSVLYKVKMIVFQDTEAVSTADLTEKILRTAP